MPAMLKLEEPEQALLRSQGGPRAVAPFTFGAQQTLFRIASQTFRVLLLRRFRLSFPLQMRICWSGRPLDVPGHHRAACTNAGILHPRGFAIQSVVARICRGLDLQDTDWLDGAAFGRVADGLPVFRGRPTCHRRHLGQCDGEGWDCEAEDSNE